MPWQDTEKSGKLRFEYEIVPNTEIGENSHLRRALTAKERVWANNTKSSNPANSWMAMDI